MPNKDKTGPAGAGPGTGRGLGNCPEGSPGSGSRRPGRGRGWRRWFGLAPRQDQEEREQ